MRILLYLLLGWTIGTISGAVGIGGGVLLVPIMMWLFDWDYPRAAGTTLAVLALPVCALAALKSYQQGRVEVEAAIWIAVTFAAGAYFGASLVRYIPAEALRFVFGVIILYVAMRFIIGSNSEAASAAAGLAGVALAWTAFVGLRLLGRRHLSRPNLGEQIRASEEKGRGEVDYYI